MEIVVRRDTRTSQSTIGVLTIMGNPYTCYTLEDQDRGLNNKMPLDEIQKAKVFGKTAIPAGRYEVVLRFSPKHGKVLPTLVNVPGFDCIEIHSGNDALDTLGCLLVGKDKAVNMITNSRLAFADLYLIIHNAIERGEKVFITIV